MVERPKRGDGEKNKEINDIDGMSKKRRGAYFYEKVGERERCSWTQTDNMKRTLHPGGPKLERGNQNATQETTKRRGKFVACCKQKVRKSRKRGARLHNTVRGKTSSNNNNYQRGGRI